MKPRTLPWITILILPVLLWITTLQNPHSGRHYKPTLIPYTPPFFKWVTAGYWPAAVESLWINVVQKAGTSVQEPEAIQAAQSFYSLATDLDPLFFELYEQGAIYFSALANEPQAAVQLLKKGIQVYDSTITQRTDLQRSKTFRTTHWVRPAILWIYFAYVYGYELQDWAHAKEAFLKAAEVPQAPAYLQNMKVWLQEKGSEKILAARILKLLIQNTDDIILKERYQLKLKEYQNTP
jgi:hypothetical protein